MPQQFKDCRFTKQDDGTIMVHDLEIFRFGHHIGFPYTLEWADATIRNHQSLEKTGSGPR